MTTASHGRAINERLSLCHFFRYRFPQSSDGAGYNLPDCYGGSHRLHVVFYPPTKVHLQAPGGMLTDRMRSVYILILSNTIYSLRTLSLVYECLLVFIHQSISLAVCLSVYRFSGGKRSFNVTEPSFENRLPPGIHTSRSRKT